MRKRLIFVILFGVLMSSVFAGGQEVYRWVDEKGTVHFADDISQIPEKYLDQFQKKKFPQEPSPSASVPPPTPGAARAIPQAASKQPAPVSKPPERKDI